MKNQAYTNDSLTMMYQGVRGALVVDVALGELGKEARFCVREISEWKQHAADLESEMLKRKWSLRSSIGRMISSVPCIQRPSKFLPQILKFERSALGVISLRTISDPTPPLRTMSLQAMTGSSPFTWSGERDPGA
jgi:hypothetical protein